MAIIAIDVFVVVISLSSPLYGWKHRSFEALAAGEVPGHPLASACCSGMLTIVIATTPSNPNANTIAITAIDVVLSIVISLSSPLYGWKQFPLDAKNAREPFWHPAASACWCSGIVTATITTTTPSTANAATMATCKSAFFLSMSSCCFYFGKSE
jgi:hypothetical protein